ATFLNDYARSANPFADLGQKTVSVQVTSVVRASDQSFQIKWTETAFDRGAEAGVSHWTGILTVKLKPPNSADVLRKNPLGLYVDAIDWSRELEPQGSPPATTGAVADHSPAPTTPFPLGSPLDSSLASATHPQLENAR
ncbi:MAG: VirB8/TrbF family protein, partial [Pseudomonadota bacterium]|nr:VirB8/TrbF family protein [Pseudomonadota bacterium]